LILVTGGAGFIGSHTVAALEAQGARVRVLDDLSTGRRENLDATHAELIVGSITDVDAVTAAMRGVTHVVHLAARISVPESCADPVGYHAVNGGGFVTVAQAARAAGVQRVVYATSCAVYGSLPGLPKREGDPVAPERAPTRRASWPTRHLRPRSRRSAWAASAYATSTCSVPGRTPPARTARSSHASWSARFGGTR
jgi:nucleoside-diphosphate-sugar epimerase